MDGVSQTLGYHYNDPGLSASPINTGDITVGGAPFGPWSGGKGFVGNIDEVSVWSTALSSGDIASIYNSGTPTNLNDHSAAANLISYWRMGDGCASPSAQGGCGAVARTGLADSSDSSDSAARVYDMSANSHNMTPTNTETDDIVEEVP